MTLVSGAAYLVALVVVAWWFDNFLNRGDAALARRMGADHPRLKLQQGFFFMMSWAVIVILLGMVPHSVWRVFGF